MLIAGKRCNRVVIAMVMSSDAMVVMAHGAM